MSNLALTETPVLSKVEEAKMLIESKLIPASYKEVSQVLAAMQYGKELGLDGMTSLTNINVIQGKPTLGIHMIAALVKKAGVAYTLTRDFVNVYHVEIPAKDLDGKDIKLVKEVFGEDEAMKYEGCKLKDRITTYTFYQNWFGKTIENEVSYRWSEAVSSGLTTKDNWTKMPRIMMRTRCLAIGARIAAPETLVGIMETSEMADVTNKNYTITEDGKVELL